jgi:hypothetical protein
MELKPSISKLGEATVHYAKGSTPNDGLMALINAIIAYKYLLTDGFTNKDPHIDKKTKTSKNALMITGYCPR